MKNLRGTALFLAVLLLTSCAPAPVQTTATIRVGVTLYRQDDTFVAQLAKRMSEAATRMEQEENIKISLEFVDAQYKQSLQNDEIEGFIQKEYDVICLNIVDRTSAASLIDKAEAANIPIILFNREPVDEDLRRWSKAFYVGADAEESGRLQGELVVNANAEHTLDRNGDGKVQYVMLEGDPGHQDALIRTNTAIKTITDAGIVLDKLATGIAYWQRVQANTKTALWLEKFGSSIELVIANNDDMALGAVDAYAAAGLSELPAVVGIDGTSIGLKAVQDGTLIGTVYNDARTQANGVMALVCALARGRDTSEIKNLDGQYIRAPYLRVNADNVDSYITSE